MEPTVDNGEIDAGGEASPEKESMDNAVPEFPIYPLNHSYCVYDGGSVVIHSVLREQLQEHIELNKSHNGDAALFINGVCVHQGTLGKERCDVIEQKLKEKDVLTFYSMGHSNAILRG